MPLAFTSIFQLDEIGIKYELYENIPEEEQKEERESEEKEGMDDLKEFTLHSQRNLTVLGCKKSKSLLKHKGFSTISGDVLTPPPEYI